jgi:hypothetical protein
MLPVNNAIERKNEEVKGREDGGEDVSR